MTNNKNSIKDNTGTTENQVVILTDRIKVINAHLKTNRKDHSSRRGLLLLDMIVSLDIKEGAILPF